MTNITRSSQEPLKKADVTDTKFLEEGYFEDVGRISNAALENRNKFIEWAHGIVTIVLFGALVSQSANLVLSWLASAFVSVIVLPFFSIATIQHGFFLRFNAIRNSIIGYVRSKGTENQESRLEYALHLLDSYDSKGLNSRTRRHLIWSVFKLGFGYLIFASLAAFVYFGAVTLLSARTDSGLETIIISSTMPCIVNLKGVAFIFVDLLVALAMIREMRFLITSRILASYQIESYEKWTKEK